MNKKAEKIKTYKCDLNKKNVKTFTWYVLPFSSNSKVQLSVSYMVKFGPSEALPTITRKSCESDFLYPPHC